MNFKNEHLYVMYVFVRVDISIMMGTLPFQDGLQKRNFDLGI